MIYHKAEKNPIAHTLFPYFPAYCGFRGRLTMCYDKASEKNKKIDKKIKVDHMFFR